jgi:hypothetical protein
MKLMNLRNLFFATALLFAVVVIAYDNLNDFTQIECELRPKMRSSRKHHYDDFKITDEHDSVYASFTHPHIPIKQSNSQNWSGYAAVTSLSSPAVNSVSAVYGSWIVPKLSSASHNTWCSLWVGIDGYGSNSVEQIGTEHDWYNGHQTNYAWFEMYPDYSYEITGFPANPGDVMSASVVYTCNGVFVLTLVNETRKLYVTIPTSYTTSLSAQRSSAEWVLEAPYYNGILPLSHFNKAYFSNCTATINNIHGSISDQFWKKDALTMVTAGGAVKAVPSSLTSNGQAFTVTWKHE